MLCLLLLTNVFLVKLNYSVAEVFLNGKNLLLLYMINQSFGGKYGETVDHLNIVFTVMQNTRRKYHQAVKIAKRRKTKTLCEKLAKSFQNKKHFRILEACKNCKKN